MPETPALTPVYAYDVFDDATARPAPDTRATPIAGAVYRWFHIDLADPGLSDWCATWLPKQAARTLMAAKTRPRVDLDGDGLLLTLRGINLNEGFEKADMVSLRLWVTPTLVVSVRRQRVFALEDLSREMHAGRAPDSSLHLIARIADNLVSRVEGVSLGLEDLADELEDHVYEGENDSPRDLPKLRRQAIKMRRHIGPMADALRELSFLKSGDVRPDLQLRLRDTASSARRSLEELGEIQDRLTALADHLDLQQSARLERNGYRLSIAAGIFLPLGFLTGLFGINVGGMPGVDDPMAFWWFTGAMVAVAAIVSVILRLMR